MFQRKRIGIVSFIIILGLVLASCGGGGVALRGEGGLGVELPGGGDGQESGGEGSTARQGTTPLLWVLTVAAVFALAAAFFRGGMR